tara:strand:+ start:886 stop:1059 length:174 start_codon:yes stop_codon:yes gene_type:complete
MQEINIDFDLKEAKTMGLSDEQTIKFIMKNNNLSRKEVKFLISHNKVHKQLKFDFVK